MCLLLAMLVFCNDVNVWKYWWINVLCSWSCGSSLCYSCITHPTVVGLRPRANWHSHPWCNPGGTGSPATLCYICIVFAVCDYTFGSLKVVPWCSNTLDCWWKDMSKLVRSRNSPHIISIDLVQEYVIRWHMYISINSNCK